MKIKELLIKKNDVEGYEPSIEFLRNNPRYVQIIQENYLDEDFEKSFQRFYASFEYKLTQKITNLTSNSLILDYGSGRCLSTLAFIKDGHRCIPFDINSSKKVGLGILQNNFFKKYNIQGILGDGEYIPLKSQMFDAIYCRESLHHAQNLELLLKNLYQVLKPNGKFFAYGDHRHPFWSSNRKFQSGHLGVQFGLNENSYLNSEYKSALKRAGFKNIRIVPIYTNNEINKPELNINNLFKGKGFIGRLRYYFNWLKYYRITGSLVIIYCTKGA